MQASLKDPANQTSPSTKIFGCLLFFLTLVLLFWRVHLGVDLTDESLYVALPFSFDLGHKVFIHESTLYQGFGLLLQPLTKLFRWAAGGSEGSFLFFRYLYFLLSALTGWHLSRLLRNWLPHNEAWMVAATTLMVVPFNIASLSYNTLPQFALANSLILVLHPAQKAWCYFGATILTGVAAMAHPVFGVMLLLFPLYWWPAGANHKSRPTAIKKAILLGFLICAMIGGAVVVAAGFDRLLEILRYQMSFGVQGGGTSKLLPILKKLIKTGYVAALVLLWIGWSRLRTLKSWQHWLAALILLPLLARQLIRDSMPPFSHPITYQVALAGLVGTIFILMKTKKRPEPLSLALLWCWTGGLLLAWASSNGLYSAVAVLMPAAALTWAQLRLWKPQGPLRLAPLLFILWLLCAQSLFAYLYRDEPIGKLSTRITHGVYEGLWTTPNKAEYIHRLQETFVSLPAKAETIFIFDNLPLGYLMTDKRPITPSLLVTARAHYEYDRSQISNFFTTKQTWPDVIVAVKKVVVSDQETYQFEYPADDAILSTFLMQGYLKKVEPSDCCDIYIRPGL
ncbi:MAG: hypothetical protein AB7N80_08275 [Bdellovibrionales bacterium]